MSTTLQGHPIRDIRPLVEMARQDAAGEKRFVWFWPFYLAGKPLDDSAAAEHLDELRQLGVRLDLKYDR